MNAQAPYQKPTAENMNQAFMHITNYAINKTNAAYQNPTDDEILRANNGSKRTLASLWDSIGNDSSREVDIEALKGSIGDACAKVMQIFAPLLEQQTVCLTNRLELGGKPFCVLGLDVLIDSDLKPWVIEVNHNPSLSIYFDDEAGMQHKRYTDADINQTDLYVNARVVGDTIKLAKKSRSAIAELESFRSLTRIHPVEGGDGIYQSFV